MSQRTKFYGLSENLEGHVVCREYGKDCRAQEFDWVPHSPRSHALNKNELCILCRTLHVDDMDMDNRHGDGRLPTTDSRRMQLRDEKNVATRIRAANENWGSYKQVPLHTLPIWETPVEDNTCQASPRLRQAPHEEAARRGTVPLVQCFLFLQCNGTPRHGGICDR